jgi:long-chain acyl-CoA synthetase
VTDPVLASLLMEHPFADGEGLLFTIDRSITAGEARAAARTLAQELTGLGVGPGSAVAVALPNGPEVVITMTAVWLAGAVFVPVNPRYPEAEVARVLDATDPAAIIRADGVTRRDAQRAYDDGVAFVMWTSGTTGAPKAILHTHEAYLELLDRVLGPLRAGGEGGGTRDPGRKPSPNLIPVSLALNAGIYNSLFGLRAGAALVIMDSFQPKEFAELVRRFEIRSTVLPPGAIAMLSDDDTLTDLTPLRYVRSITAPLSPLQARRFTTKFGAFVLNSYGQAEIGEVIGWTAADAKEHPEKVGAIGRPHHGVDLKVVDDAGSELGTDEIGALFVRPPNMAAGYATGEELSDRVDADGYVNTGDLARVDDDGFVWIEGRAGDLINRGGNKVFPEQVEEVLCLAPGISQAAVVGVPDDRLGEVPVAFVVGVASDEELTALCREHLVPYKVPVAFERVDALPRTEVGKVMRRQLVSEYQSRAR